jgi:hypothetical protein
MKRLEVERIYKDDQKDAKASVAHKVSTYPSWGRNRAARRSRVVDRLKTRKKYHPAKNTIIRPLLHDPSESNHVRMLRKFTGRLNYAK